MHRIYYFPSYPHPNPSHYVHKPERFSLFRGKNCSFRGFRGVFRNSPFRGSERNGRKKRKRKWCYLLLLAWSECNLRDIFIKRNRSSLDKKWRNGTFRFTIFWGDCENLCKLLGKKWRDSTNRCIMMTLNIFGRLQELIHAAWKKMVRSYI